MKLSLILVGLLLVGSFAQAELLTRDQQIAAAGAEATARAQDSNARLAAAAASVGIAVVSSDYALDAKVIENCAVAQVCVRYNVTQTFVTQKGNTLVSKYRSTVWVKTSKALSRTDSEVGSEGEVVSESKRLETTTQYLSASDQGQFYDLHLPSVLTLTNVKGTEVPGVAVEVASLTDRVVVGQEVKEKK